MPQQKKVWKNVLEQVIVGNNCSHVYSAEKKKNVLEQVNALYIRNYLYYNNLTNL